MRGFASFARKEWRRGWGEWTEWPLLRHSGKQIQPPLLVIQIVFVFYYSRIDSVILKGKAARFGYPTNVLCAAITALLICCDRR